jgi:hypothetical protein
LGLQPESGVVGLDPAYVLRSLLIQRVRDGSRLLRSPIPWIGRFDGGALLTIFSAPPVDRARVAFEPGERQMLVRSGIRGSLDG